MTDIGQLLIALRASDVSLSAEFYEKLGFVPEDEANWHAGYARFSYRGTRVLLLDFIPQSVLLNLEQCDQDAVEALGKRLTERGIAVGPAGSPGSGNNGLYLEDPDGHGFFIFTNASA